MEGIPHGKPQEIYQALLEARLPVLRRRRRGRPLQPMGEQRGGDSNVDGGASGSGPEPPGGRGGGSGKRRRGAPADAEDGSGADESSGDEEPGHDAADAGGQINSNEYRDAIDRDGDLDGDAVSSRASDYMAANTPGGSDHNDDGDGGDGANGAVPADASAPHRPPADGTAPLPPPLIEPAALSPGEDEHPLLPPVVDAVVPAPADEGNVAELLVGTSWGAFTLCAVQPDRLVGRNRNSTPHGGYQATCPFHRRNQKTGCKRFFRIMASTQQAKLQCLKAALYWCGTYHSHTRQRHHVRAPLPAVLPAYNVIKHWKVEGRPARRDIKTDEELDAEEEPDEIAPAASSASSSSDSDSDSSSSDSSSSGSE